MRPAALILIALSLLPVAAGLGVSPASHLQFGAGNVTYELRILLPERQNMDLLLEPTGSLAPYISVEPARIEVSALQRETQARVTLNIPEDLPPGEHTGGILITRAAPEGTSGVTAVAAVRHGVSVIMPRPGKHLSLDVSSSAPSTNRPVVITLHLHNTGTDLIREASATLSIENAGEQEVLTGTANRIPSDGRRDIPFSWSPDAPGVYTITAEVAYDGEQAAVAEDILVGELAVEVGGPVLGTLVPGAPVRVDIPVTNLWNRPIPGVVAKVEVVRSGIVVDSFETLRETIAPGPSTLTGYWDTAGEAPGEHLLDITVHYADRDAKSSASVTLSQNEESSPVWPFALGAVLLVLVPALFIWRRLRR